MKVGSFALLCQAVLACENLDRAVKRMLRGLTLFLDDIHGERSLEGRQAVVQILNRIESDCARRFADETFLVPLHGLMCWLIGRRSVLDDVCFAHARPTHAHEYTVMYSQHVVFDVAVTCIRFDASALSVPTVQNAASLRSFQRTAPQSVFLKYKNEESWTAWLRRRLRAARTTRSRRH